MLYGCCVVVVTCVVVVRLLYGCCVVVVWLLCGCCLVVVLVLNGFCLMLDWRYWATLHSYGLTIPSVPVCWPCTGGLEVSSGHLPAASGLGWTVSGWGVSEAGVAAAGEVSLAAR